MNDLSVPHCYRHPDRETHIRCQRCNRPICPDCMRDAAVGFQCPDCIKDGARSTRQAEAARGMSSGDPRLTSWVLIGINIAVFVLVQAVPRFVGLFSQHVAGYCGTTDGGGYYPNAASEGLCQLVGGDWVPGLASGAWWQAVTQMFTHEAVWHIASNMFVLYFLGPLVESAMGRARFLALYLVAGLAGGLSAALLSSPESSVLGASGAIWGLMAAALVLAVRNRVTSMRDSLLQMVGLNVVITVVGFQFISWQGHLGGFVGGALAAAVIVFAPRGPRRSTLQFVGLGLLALLIVAGYVVRALTA